MYRESEFRPYSGSGQETPGDLKARMDEEDKEIEQGLNIKDISQDRLQSIGSALTEAGIIEMDEAKTLLVRGDDFNLGQRERLQDMIVETRRIIDKLPVDVEESIKSDLEKHIATMVARDNSFEKMLNSD